MNVIISAAIGMSSSQLLPFIGSARNCIPNCQIHLLVRYQDIDKLQVLKKGFPQLVFRPTLSRFPKSFIARRYLSNTLRLAKKIGLSYDSCVAGSVTALTIHIALRRYMIAERILANLRTKPTMVMLADSRDVIFQGDPFQTKQLRLLCGLECRSIGQCPTNSSWIRNLYGEKKLEKLSSKLIACSGLIIGGYNEVRDYLSQMNAEIWSLSTKIPFECGYDQGIHNYLTYSHPSSLPMDTTTNEQGYISTLGYESPDNFDLDLSLNRINVYGKAPLVVHQYDRHPKLNGFVSSIYT